MRAKINASTGWLALAMVLLAAGCQEGGPELRGVSHGPELVLTEAALPPELAEPMLFNVVGLAVVESADGDPGVALADAGNHRLVFWWPDRGRVEFFGREGEGPGEFGSIRAVWPAGDAFLV